MSILATLDGQDRLREKVQQNAKVLQDLEIEAILADNQELSGQYEYKQAALLAAYGTLADELRAYLSQCSLFELNGKALVVGYEDGSRGDMCLRNEVRDVLKQYKNPTIVYYFRAAYGDGFLADRSKIAVVNVPRPVSPTAETKILPAQRDVA